jgi:hypothetical protein
MPGAGSSTVAWAPESSYLGGTGGTPTYRVPGTNVQVQDIELTRNLLAILAPGDVETQQWLAQQMEGALGLSWILKNDEFHRLVFNDGFTSFTSGLANSAEWYLGVDYASGTTERQIKGFASARCSLEYSGPTEAVRVTLVGAYGDEEQNTSITPGTIADTGSEVAGHGASLSINSNTVTKLQSATLTFENIARLQRGPSVKPIEAVAGNVTQSIDMQTIYQGPERYKLALGGPTANTIEKSVDQVPGSLSFDAPDGTTIADYQFSDVAPENYNWQDLVNNDADLNESVQFNATGVTASDPTA